MNNDLISRSALKKAITANHYLLSAKHNSTDYGMFTTGIMEAIDNAPTVIATEDAKQKLIKDCQPPTDDWEAYADKLHDIAYKYGYEQAERDLKRPHGKWIPQTDHDGFTYWKCSECGKRNDFAETKFCWDCGADMRGDNT